MPERDSVGPEAGDDWVAWARERWRWILALLLLLFLAWRFSGKPPEPNGRYLLVKDDVPCQVQPEDEDGRRWCYVVLDTCSGRLEERVRRMDSKKRK